MMDQTYTENMETRYQAKLFTRFYNIIEKNVN